MPHVEHAMVDDVPRPQPYYCIAGGRGDGAATDLHLAAVYEHSSTLATPQLGHRPPHSAVPSPHTYSIASGGYLLLIFWPRLSVDRSEFKVTPRARGVPGRGGYCTALVCGPCLDRSARIWRRGPCKLHHLQAADHSTSGTEVCRLSRLPMCHDRRATGRVRLGASEGARAEGGIHIGRCWCQWHCSRSWGTRSRLYVVPLVAVLVGYTCCCWWWWQVCNPSTLTLNLRRPSSGSMGDRATQRLTSG